MNTLDLLTAANPVPPASIENLRTELPGPARFGASGQSSRRSVRLRFGALATACAVVLVVAAAPALALRTSLYESIHDFLVGNAPAQAHEAITTLLKSSMSSREGSTPDQIALALNTTGPDGGVQLYSVHFANGDLGLAMVDVSNEPARIGGVTSGSSSVMSPSSDQAFDVRGSFIALPGSSPAYFDGVVRDSVAKVTLQYADGQTQAVDIGNGFMLGWIAPQSGVGYGDAMLIGRNAQGAEIGRTDVCSVGKDVQFRPHTSDMPKDVTAACALAPPRDN